MTQRINRAPFKRFSREHDEAVLDWITRMHCGEQIRHIARDYSVSPGTVSRAVKAVMEESL